MQTFLQQIEEIPWLKNLGESSMYDQLVYRIKTWENFEGPETPGNTALNYYIQNLYKLHVENDTKSQNLFNTIKIKVTHIAKSNLPYDLTEDPWYGPTAAVLSVAYFAALIGCMIYKDEKIEDKFDTKNQISPSSLWWWYKNGYWPCDIYDIKQHVSSIEVEAAIKGKTLVVF